MASSWDIVHSHGMSPRPSVYLTVNEYSYDSDNSLTKIEPPLRVILEGDSAVVAIDQDGLTVRYYDEELCTIGEGSSMLGLRRVIGDIAVNGNLVYGELKPLHPGMVKGYVVSPAELPENL